MSSNENVNEPAPLRRVRNPSLVTFECLLAAGFFFACVYVYSQSDLLDIWICIAAVVLIGAWIFLFDSTSKAGLYPFERLDMERWRRTAIITTIWVFLVAVSRLPVRIAVGRPISPFSDLRDGVFVVLPLATWGASLYARNFYLFLVRQKQARRKIAQGNSHS